MSQIKVLVPKLPTADKILPYLKQIDQNNYYSNMGPLLFSFEERLANHFGAKKEQIVTTANGTLGLLQALKSYDVEEGSLCLMPSWTFTATPSAAVFAGLKPYFLDVDKDHWIIHPEQIFPLIKKLKIGAVIPVAPFGAPLDIQAWYDFHRATNIPVVIDAAACFDSMSLIKNNCLPYMVSFHATKSFGIGEGAAIISPSEEFAHKVRMNGNFGFLGTRDSVFPGLNCKLSEYAAAVGLAALDEWNLKREEWSRLSSHFFRNAVNNDKYSPFPKSMPSWISSYGLLKFKNVEDLKNVKLALSSQSIDTIAWWGKGCHSQTAYKNYGHNHLPNTEYLAERVLGLPFWLGLESETLDRIFTVINHTVKANFQESLL